MQCGRLPTRPAGIPTGPPATTGMPELRTPLDQHQPGRPCLQRPVGIPVRLAPGVAARPRDRVLALHLLVIRLELLVVDRPVGRHPVERPDPEVRRVEARAERRVVYGAPAHASPRVVRAQLQRLAPARDPQVVPVQSRRARLVRNHVRLRVVPVPRLERHHREPVPGQPLRQHAAARARPDDAEIHRLRRRILAHLRVQHPVGRQVNVQLHDLAPFSPASRGSHGSGTPSLSAK